MVLKPAISLNDFVGVWTMDRRITDTRGGPNGLFYGIATFNPKGAGLAYVETGTLLLEGQAAFKAERRYQWSFTDDKISINFQDGRAFHSFDPAAPAASHWCDPDTYHVKYNFDAWPVWQSTWSVSGPQKAYQMITQYVRAPV